MVGSYTYSPDCGQVTPGMPSGRDSLRRNRFAPDDSPILPRRATRLDPCSPPLPVRRTSLPPPLTLFRSSLILAPRPCYLSKQPSLWSKKGAYATAACARVLQPPAARRLLISFLFSQPNNHPATVNELVSRYVAANNFHDAAAMNALLHPKSLACVTPENRDFYDRAVEVSMRQPIPSNCHFTDTPLTAKDALPLKDYGTFPVPPTHQIQVEYERAEDSGTVMFWLVSENARWYKDDLCINASIIKQFHDDLPNIKAREQATKTLVAQIQDPLLSELKSLLKQGQSATASRRYAEVTGKDGDTSLAVIDELEFQLRQQHFLQ